MNRYTKIGELDLECIVPETLHVNTSACELFIEQIKSSNVLPFNKGDMRYSDDVWDFSKYRKKVVNVSNSILRISFTAIVKDFKDDLKSYALLKILESKNKIQYINQCVSQITSFFNYANSRYCYHIEDVGDDIIAGFIESLEEQNLSYSTISKYIYSIKSFYEVYSANFKNILTEDIKKQFNIDRRLLKSQSEIRKTPDIPKNYYNKFLSSIIKIIDDKSINYYIRATACVYLILSQTGLRISEILELSEGTMNTATIFNGEEAYFLKYKTWKGQKGDNTFRTVDIFVNELSKKGYDELIEIYKSKRKKLGLEYLFLGGEASVDFPVTSNGFEDFRDRLFIYMDNEGYLETINIEEVNKQLNIPSKKVRTWLKNTSTKHKVITTITYPTTIQYRVHVCTELYNAGVPLSYIKKFMSHLTDDMEGYYVRTTVEKPQEDAEFAYKTIENIVTGETKPLTNFDNGLCEKIEKFINENNFNIEKDTKTIVEKLVNEIPVRQKSGGVCIKSSIRTCSLDYSTDEFYCAFGVCPNIFHFYYMADFSYKMAKECEVSFLYHKNNGFLKQAQKELHKLKRTAKDKLAPELDELKNVVARKGYDVVVQEYPDLSNIILNIDEIYGEIKQWLKLKM